MPNLPDLEADSGLASIFDALSQLEDMVRSKPGLTPIDLAEGYLFVSGLYKWGIDRVFLGLDDDRPRLIRFLDTFSKWGMGNPDNVYLVAEIRSDAEYVVSGTRGSCADFIIEVRTGIGRKENDVHSETICYAEASTLKLDANGEFELYLGGAQREGNHLPLREDATTVFIRQTFGDWTKESMRPFSIRRLGVASPPAPQPTPADVKAKFERAAAMILALGKFNDRTAEEWRAAFPVNGFPKPTTKVGDGFFPGQHSSIGQFQLSGPADALLVTLDAVESRYLGFSIGHHHWYTSFDYHNRQCSLNTAQAHRSSDGRYRYVISAVDPGIPNWIDTGGHLSGFMFFRCQGLTSESLGHPTARLLPLSEVRSALPVDEPVVTEAQRFESLEARRRGAYRRFAY